MPLNAMPPICSICGRAMFDKEHTCPPAWRVWDEDQGQTREDARLVYTTTPDSAAEAWAEHDDNDSAEYSIAKGTPTVVCVAREPDGPVEKFKVHGEYQPVYWAEPVS